MAKLWRWEEGRQGTNYKKLLLWITSWWDLYIIYYPPKSYIPPHRDPVDGKRHFRLNIVLWGNTGAFYLFGPFLWRWWRATLFRPDLYEHGVTTLKGKRIVLSFGWVRKKT